MQAVLYLINIILYYVSVCLQSVLQTDFLQHSQLRVYLLDRWISVIDIFSINVL